MRGDSLLRRGQGRTMRAAPETVCAASASALSRGSPAATAPSASASMARNTYAGPLPLSPVTASIMRSSTGMASPALARTTGLWCEPERSTTTQHPTWPTYKALGTLV